MHTTVMRFVDHGLPIPKIESAEAAGLVVTAAEDAEIKSGGFAPIKTGFVWDIPHGHTGLVTSVMPLISQGVQTMSALIPAKQSLDERNELSVVLQNMGDKPFTVKKGDVVGHVVVLPVHGARGVRETVNPDMSPAPAEEKPVTSVQAYINAKEAAGWYGQTSKRRQTRSKRSKAK